MARTYTNYGRRIKERHIERKPNAPGKKYPSGSPSEQWNKTQLRAYVSAKTREVNEAIKQYRQDVKDYEKSGGAAGIPRDALFEADIYELQELGTGKHATTGRVTAGLKDKTNAQLTYQAYRLESALTNPWTKGSASRVASDKASQSYQSFKNNWMNTENLTTEQWNQLIDIFGVMQSMYSDYGYEDNESSEKNTMVQSIIDAIVEGVSPREIMDLLENIKQHSLAGKATYQTVGTIAKHVEFETKAKTMAMKMGASGKISSVPIRGIRKLKAKDLQKVKLREAELRRKEKVFLKKKKARKGRFRKAK